jgi:hypothetical protein
VVEHGLHDSGEHTLRNFGADLNGVLSVLEDLGLNDGDETIVLADGTVAGKAVGGFLDSKI